MLQTLEGNIVEYGSFEIHQPEHPTLILGFSMISLRRLLQPLSPLQRSYTTQPPAAPLRVSPSSSEKKQSPSLEALGYTIVDPDAQRTAIDAIGPTSFTVSGVRVTGSILLTSHFATLWNVSHISHLSPPAFALVKLLFPRPDFVLIGTGALSLVCSFLFTWNMFWFLIYF